MHPPLIETPRLTIRQLETGDAEKVFRYRSLPRVYAYQAWKPEGPAEIADYIREADAAGFGAAGRWFQLGVFLGRMGNLIGDIGINFLLPDNLQTEIGFTIDPRFQRMGYGLESVHAVVDYLFTVMSKHRVIAKVDPENGASIGLLRKLGFRSEGRFVKSVLIRGRWEDDEVFAMLEEEWAARHRGS